MREEKELKKGMADCLSLIDTPGSFVKGLQEFLLQIGATDSERDYQAWLPYLDSFTLFENPWVRRLVLLCLWQLAKKIPGATPELKKILMDHDQDGAMEVREEIPFAPEECRTASEIFGKHFDKATSPPLFPACVV